VQNNRKRRKMNQNDEKIINGRINQNWKILKRSYFLKKK
jgi:hypothetical protein